MSLMLTSTKQPVFKVPFAGVEGSRKPWEDNHERIFRPYQGNECLTFRSRTGFKGEILTVSKSKLEERKT